MRQIIFAHWRPLKAAQKFFTLLAEFFLPEDIFLGGKNRLRYMESLTNLIKSASKQLRTDALCSIVVFPKTESLADDKSSISITQERLDFDAIIEQINRDPEAIALSMRTDIQPLIGVLKEVKEELLLDKFDMVQMYRCGLNILRITLPNKSGRCVHIEMNDYRRKLAQLLSDPHPLLKNAALICVTALVVVLAERWLNNHK